jgi:tetratricopeptide (TPR) repeat protein
MMSRNWPVYALLLALVVALGAALGPHALALYHLEAGGRALEAALGTSDTFSWWYLGPQHMRDDGASPNAAALDDALRHLDRAGSFAQAWRLLGAARAAQGDLLGGAQALQRFTQLRPQHDLGYMELAAAYLAVDERLGAMRYADLLAALPGAVISAPDLEGETTYQADRWSSEYAYPTTFSLPPEYGERPTLFLHAGARVTYTLSLTQPAVLRFAMGLDRRALGWGSDGATFEVFVNGQRLFLEHLPADVAQQGWQEREVDLGAYAGQTVRLALATTPGPVGDVTGDWAGWGEPRVEDAQATAYRQVVRGRPWLVAWKAAGAMAEEFIAAGESARKEGQYAAALAWQGWAMRIEPGRGDPWYYAGLVYEAQEQWSQALDAYRRATEIGRFQYAPDSSPYYHLGALYQWHVEPPQLEQALAAYERAIQDAQFASAWEEADCHYKRGEVLSWQQAEPGEYIAEFRQAVAIDPAHAWAHIRLGLALYARDRDTEAAQDLLLQAIELAPQNKWAYYYLGEVYRQEGHLDEAKQMYKAALALDPGFETAQAWLAALNEDE